MYTNEFINKQVLTYVQNDNQKDNQFFVYTKRQKIEMIFEEYTNRIQINKPVKLTLQCSQFLILSTMLHSSSFCRLFKLFGIT